MRRFGFWAWLCALAGMAGMGSRAHAQTDDRGPPGFRPPPWFVTEGKLPRSLSLTIDPVAVVLGRFGARLEYVVTRGHAVSVAPFLVYAAPGHTDTLTGNEVELGYRYYTGTRGPHGFFAGASAMLSSYRYASVTLKAEYTWDAVGFMADGGYQWLLAEHVVLGLGAGVQYRYYPLDPVFETAPRSFADWVYGAGIRPRAFLSLGGAL